MFKTNGKAAKPHAAHVAWKTLRFSRRQCLGLDLTEIQGKKSEDRNRRRTLLIDKDERSRNAPVGMLPSGLLEKDIERLAAAVEDVPVMRSRQQFELKHGLSF